MEFNPANGRNGKKVQTTEVMGMNMDIAEVSDDKAMNRSVMRYFNQKKDSSSSTVDEVVPSLTNPNIFPSNKKTEIAQKKAFNRLSMMKRAEPPKGTVGSIEPMEIRVKQLSLFPGIY